jgi:hypothetical protein
MVLMNREGNFPVLAFYAGDLRLTLLPYSTIMTDVLIPDIAEEIL